MSGTPLRIAGIASSDSYVKWGSSLISHAPEEWEKSFLVMLGPIAVSPTQQVAALSKTVFTPAQVPRVGYDRLIAHLEDARPDAVLVATTGPLARVLVRRLARLVPRPVIVTGLPGISIPATNKALLFRAQSDLMVLHSIREIDEFRTLAARRGCDHRFGLSSLPFAIGPGRARREPKGGDLVFAAQAIVPCDPVDRMRIAEMLRAAARADPTRRVVVKLRARRGEHQTHTERHAYPALLDELGSRPPNLVISTAPMSAALERAHGLVSVSSTALIEAIARGVPVIALDSFGVGDELINRVFEGSGLFGSAEDVVARRFRRPDPAWLRENYFHSGSEDDWGRQVGELVTARRRGTLAERVPPTGGGRLREAWERKRALGAADRTLSGTLALAIGVPMRAVWSQARRIRAGEREH